MQVFPFIGSTALVAGAAYAVFLAVQQDTATIPVIGGTDAQVQQGPTARPISLVPNQRNDTYYAAITQRPLFEQTRRPISPDAAPEPEVEEEEEVVTAPTAPAEIPAPDVQLLGVLAGGARNAALLSLAGDDPEWHRDGDTIDGWTVSQIAADHVILTEKTRELRVELYQR